ncbi:MAG: cytochrome bc complex cytochrome b subunit [Actinomycetes bacterium]
MTSQPTSSATTATGKIAGHQGRTMDERLGLARVGKMAMRKVFPDHWSFLLGEIALYSFIILLLTGVFLTFFFDPSVKLVTYNGSYVPLKGVQMTQAYSSTLHISFDVRGGLLMRQIHHWAALLFVASIGVHMCRIFFTGAFRKPREINWTIGVGLLTLALLEGFAGYSLPDDLLSGSGLRIAYSIVESIPVVGTYAGFFLFGGNYPGPQFIPRLFTIHVLLIPGILLALISAHMIILVRQKHTQFPGKGKTEHNVVGSPLYPGFSLKTGGFFMLIFGLLSLLSAVAQINPVWLYGPYNPSQVSAGTQPDWYIGWLDGTLRLMPNVEWNFAHHYTLSMNILFPAVILPGLLFTLLALYPFIEAWVTGDHGHHHLLDRPRNRPNRTAIGMAMMSMFVVLLFAGGNDIIAEKFSLSINELTWTFRAMFFLLPPIVFVITKRICLGLQRRDRDLLHHGEETGTIKMLPSGEFIEVHAPAAEQDRLYISASAATSHIPELEAAYHGTDGNGHRRRPVPTGPAAMVESARRRIIGFFYDEVEPEPEGDHHTPAVH